MLATSLADIKQTLSCKIYCPSELWFGGLNQNMNLNPAVVYFTLLAGGNEMYSLYSLFPPGQQQGVIEQVEVHRFGWELELWAGNVHHLSVHFQELTMLHQPSGLRDQRKYLQRRSHVKNTPELSPLWRKTSLTFPSKWIFLLRWISSSILFIDCTLELHSLMI